MMNYKVFALALSLGVLAGCGRDRCGSSCKDECSTEVCKVDTRETTKVAQRESGPLSETTVAWDSSDYGTMNKENYEVA